MNIEHSKFIRHVIKLIELGHYFTITANDATALYSERIELVTYKKSEQEQRSGITITVFSQMFGRKLATIVIGGHFIVNPTEKFFEHRHDEVPGFWLDKLNDLVYKVGMITEEEYFESHEMVYVDAILYAEEVLMEELN